MILFPFWAENESMACVEHHVASSFSDKIGNLQIEREGRKKNNQMFFKDDKENE